jgi:transcription initiation factor TFIID subunit 7
MEDDHIVVDDVEDPRPPPVNEISEPSSIPKPDPKPAPALSTRPRRAVTMMAPPMAQAENSERTTRSAVARSKPQPKLKLKLSEKTAAQAPGMSFLGPYDRELDSDPEEELAFEEQFILRMPPGDDCELLRKMVAEREVSNDVWFKFKGARKVF